MQGSAWKAKLIQEELLQSSNNLRDGNEPSK